MSLTAYGERRVGDLARHTVTELALACREAFYYGAKWQDGQTAINLGSPANDGSISVRPTNPDGAIVEARQRYPLPQLIVRIGNLEFSASFEGHPVWREVDAGEVWRRDVGQFLVGEPAVVHKILKALLDVLEDHVGFGA